MARAATSPGASYGRIIWAPTLTNHDPNPPLTILDGPGLNDTVVETAAATATQTATAAFVASVTESVAATETQSAGLSFSDSVVETVSAADSQQAAIDFPASIAETVTASDSCVATVIVPPVPPVPPIPPAPPATAAPLPGPLYGLTNIGVASAEADLEGIGVAGNKDSLRIIPGPVT